MLLDIIGIGLLGLVFWVLFKVVCLEDNSDDENQNMGLKL